MTREARSHTLAHFVRLALRSGDTELEFADRVASTYRERTALAERVIEFHAGTTTDQIIEAKRANAQLLRRMLAGEVRLPVDLEESIVLAMPAAVQRRCLAELCDRLDLLAVPKPRDDAAGQARLLSDLCREFGEAVERIAPMLHDGGIDAGDRAQAPAALRELNDVIAAAIALRAQIETSALGLAPVAQIAPRRSA